MMTKSFRKPFADSRIKPQFGYRHFLGVISMAFFLLALVAASNILGNFSGRVEAHQGKGSQTGSFALPSQKNRVSKNELWQPVKALSSTGQPDNQARLQAYATRTLNRAALRETLNQAPVEFTEAAKTERVMVTLPMPDGSLAAFRIEESPIMEPALAAQFPELKTYSGQSVDDPTTTTRFDWTP